MSLSAVSRSEVTKQFSTSLWWILGIVLVVYVGFTATVLAFVFSAAATGNLGENAPPLPEEGLSSTLYSTATSIGYVFPLLIGTLMVTGEFRHKTLTPTFLGTPRRGMVLAAKLVVGVGMGVLFGVLGILSAAIPTVALMSGYGIDTELGSSDTWAMFGRMMLAFVLWVIVGIGVGALVRSQVGAIVGVLVFTQFIEPVGRSVSTFVEGLSDVTRFLPGAASDALVGTSVFTAPAAFGGGAEQLEWWAGGLVLLAYGIVLLVLGHLTSWRRDVS